MKMPDAMQVEAHQCPHSGRRREAPTRLKHLGRRRAQARITDTQRRRAPPLNKSDMSKRVWRLFLSRKAQSAKPRMRRRIWSARNTPNPPGYGEPSAPCERRKFVSL